MDIRIKKTETKILTAFKKLLKSKKYEDITIEDILEKSGVARSTFYKHFDTKGDVLYSLIDNIFVHVFGVTLKEEESHDFSKTSILDYKHYIEHILYHIDDEKEIIHSLLNSSSKSILIDSLVKEFTPFAINCIDNNFFTSYNIPKPLQLNAVVASFITIIVYWDRTGFQLTPERLTDYFISLNR